MRRRLVLSRREPGGGWSSLLAHHIGAIV